MKGQPYAGKHYYWREHRLYNKLVAAEWQAFFKGVEPGEITDEMANRFVSKIKANPEAKTLIVQILKKGGVKEIPE